MAGGKGTRLRPLTCSLPKPMVPIINKPVMEYTVKLLKNHNITDVAVTTAYLPELITEYFKGGEEWGVHLSYYMEDHPLGTGGSVRNAEEYIDETFIVISGDALTDLNITDAIEYHRRKRAKVTLVLKREPEPIEYGVVITNHEGRITRFLEKPSWGEVFSNTVNTGIYIIEPEVMNYYSKGDNFDFSKDLFPKLLKDHIPMYGYITEDYWCDIGDLKSYKETQFDILEGKVKVEIEGNKITDGVWIGEGTRVHEDAEIIPPAYIGRDSSIAPCKIGPYAVISDNCIIERAASFKKAIMWKDSKIAEETHFSGGVACNKVDIKSKVNFLENAVIGEGSMLSEGVMVKPDIKIWPHKKVEAKTVINQNLIWGTKASKTVFGYRDISGYLNLDITPEFAVGMGSAFATILKGGTIVVSDDQTNGSFIVRSSIITGIHASGGQAIYLPNSIIPMNRFAVKYHQADGGIHIRTDYLDKNKIYIDFIDKNGANISRSKEREMENLLNRGDFSRCNADRMRQTVTIENFSSLYIKKGIDFIENQDKIKHSQIKVAVASNSATQIRLTKEYLHQLGCRVEDYSSKGLNSMEEHIENLKNQVLEKKANFGALISENGEDIIIVDDHGNLIDLDKYLLLAALIAMKKESKDAIVLPYTAPNILERMAENYKVEVKRTKSNPSSIMNEMLSLTDESFPIQYVLNYNAVWAMGIIIDLIVAKDLKISDLAEEIPNYYYLKEEIPCDWKDKGRVIKELIAENREEDLELFEGVKIKDDKGWALILPDHEKPIFKLYTEGFSEEYAQELSGFFSKKIKDLLGNQRQ
ncbi:sugar phosphate nucleotidyltransferase [Alkaliphilus serpentinus]|nr:sugar phosphate nucleotidyltransferase [Alkaliphilus serpentinus]